MHLLHMKHFMWKICRGAAAVAGLLPPPVRITNSLAGIAWPHAEHAPELPNNLRDQRKKSKR